MVSSISGFAPKSQVDESLAEELKRSEEILKNAQTRTAQGAKNVDVIRKETTQGRTSAETIGKGIGRAIFGNKPLKERERMQGELEDAQRLAQEHVQQARIKASANKLSAEKQAEVDLNINEALDQYRASGQVDEVVQGSLNRAFLNDATRAQVAANYGKDASLQGVTPVINPQTGEILVTLNVVDSQGNPVNAGTRVVTDALGDKGDSRIKQTGEIQANRRRQQQIQQAEKDLDPSVGAIEEITAKTDALGRISELEKKGIITPEIAALLKADITGLKVTTTGGEVGRQFEGKAKGGGIASSIKSLDIMKDMVFDESGNLNEDFRETLLSGSFGNLSVGKGRAFNAAANASLLGVLRAESGAAVTEPELDRYLQTFIPSVLDNEETIKLKLNMFEDRINSIADFTGVTQAMDKAQVLQSLEQDRLLAEAEIAKLGTSGTKKPSKSNTVKWGDL